MENDKPVILLIKETEDKLLEIVNKSGLPAFFMHRIFQTIDNELQKIEIQELSFATDNYKKKKQESLKKKGVKND